MNFCHCGCGGIAKEGNKFIWGHNGRCFTEDTLKKLRGRSAWNKDLTKDTDERVKKNSENMTRTIREQYKNGRVAWNKNLTKETDERVARYGRKSGQSRKGLKLSEECCKKISLKLRGRPSPTKGLKRPHSNSCQCPSCKIKRHEISSPAKGKKWRRKTPAWSKGLTKETDERLAKMGKKISEKKRGRKFPVELYPNMGLRNSNLLKLTLQNRRQNYPYWFMNVPFDSNEEREVAKALYKLINFIPEEGVNCHVRMNGGEFDFRLRDNLFMEYHPWENHPWDGGLTTEQYYQERRKILDENGFKSSKLIILKCLENIKRVLERECYAIT